MSHMGIYQGDKAPAFNSIMDDPDTARASVQKLAALGVRTVYPGHGALFAMEQFLASYQ